MSKTELTIQPAMTFRADVGAWEGVPMEVYHAADGESNSSLAVLADSPAKYKLLREGKLERTETRDMQLGTIIHGMVSGDETPYHITPETYGTEGKKWNNGAKECKDWVAAHRDKPIFTADTAAMLSGVRAAMLRNAMLGKLLNGARCEVSALARNSDLELPYLLRVRFDILGRDSEGWYFADIKSTRSANTRAFQSEIKKREYHAQMALYRRVLAKLTGEKVRCFMVAVEKSPTLPRINVRQLTAAAMDEGDKIIDERLRLLKRCRLTNTWPDFADDEGGQSIPFIDLPEYCYGDVDALTGMTETESTEGESNE
jgi:hypothetical protein